MGKLTIEFSAGGGMGPRAEVKIGGKYLGYFYVDSERGVDADEVLELIVDRFNAAEGGR